MEKVVGIKQLRASKRPKNYSAVPQWVVVMYSTVFFRACATHPDSKLDRFCADCYSSLCSNCLPVHARHKHVKIRRYMYSDVINRQDLSKLFNCSGIQTYLTNKAKVLFLKRRNHYHHQRIISRTVVDASSVTEVCKITIHTIAVLHARLRPFMEASTGKMSTEFSISIKAIKKRSSAKSPNVLKYHVDTRHQ